MMQLVSITLSARTGVAGRSQNGEAHVKKLKRGQKLSKGNSDADADGRDRERSNKRGRQASGVRCQRTRRQQTWTQSRS